MQGFEIIDDLDKTQVSADYYDATLNNIVSVDGELRTEKGFYALQPTSLSSHILPAIDKNNINESRSIIKGEGRVFFFDFAMNASPTLFGIETYDENGKLTFTSSTLSLDVIDFIEIESVLGINGDVYFDKTYPAHVRPAVIPMLTPFWAADSPSSYWSMDAATVGYKSEGSRLICSKAIASPTMFPRQLQMQYYDKFTAYVIDTKGY